MIVRLRRCDAESRHVLTSIAPEPRRLACAKHGHTYAHTRRTYGRGPALLVLGSTVVRQYVVTHSESLARRRLWKFARWLDGTTRPLLLRDRGADESLLTAWHFLPLAAGNEPPLILELLQGGDSSN